MITNVYKEQSAFKKLILFQGACNDLVRISMTYQRLRVI